MARESKRAPYTPTVNANADLEPIRGSNMVSKIGQCHRSHPQALALDPRARLTDLVDRPDQRKM
jgi:hypothetical protein